MWIKSINVKNCRNLKDVSLILSPHINIIIGKNASGKTSLLEAISILSSGKSFRSSHITDVISTHQKSVLISALLSNSDTHYNIGIQKTSSKTKIRINQQDVYSQAELSLHLPVTTIHPGSIDIITGSPSKRRSYIDWLAFYLFSNFHSLWKQYNHVLKQRNICLKNNKHRFALDKWTNQLVELQPEINKYRNKTIALINPLFKEISSHLFKNKDVNLIYKSGFPLDLKIDKASLKRFYQEKLDSDIAFKRTHNGIHRADIDIFLNSKPAINNASRGQLKLLTISLLLAQNLIIYKQKKIKGLVLIDDLAAELDESNAKLLLQYIFSLNQQIIITTTHPLNIDKPEKLNMFHVKHGEIELL